MRMNVLAPVRQVQPVIDDRAHADAFDLLNDFATLRTRLSNELEVVLRAVGDADEQESAADPSLAQAVSPLDRHEHVLNAFLVAAGLNQILEDYLHRDRLLLRKISKNVKRLRIPLAGVGGDATRLAANAITSSSGHTQTTRRLLQLRQAFQVVLQLLASETILTMPESEEAGSARQEQCNVRRRHLEAANTALQLSLHRVPEGLARAIVRLPSCFRSFDQHPLDCMLVTERFAAKWSDRDQPLLVVGIRTSGSYLGPLYVACLRNLGYMNVKSVSLRPGQPWLPGEAQAIRRLAARARVLVADDPPASGSALITVVNQLEELGISQPAISLLLPLFGAATTLPTQLRCYDAHCLAFEDWNIHQRLSSEAVQRALAQLLSGQIVRATALDGSVSAMTIAEVESVERIPLSLPTDEPSALPHLRGHERARFLVHVVGDDAGARGVLDVYVKGTGLGYFGEYSLAAYASLAHFMPRQYGLRDGLLYREWVPEGWRLSAIASPFEEVHQEIAASSVASYVAKRSRALAVRGDPTPLLRDRDPLWESTARFLGQSYRRAAPFALPALSALMRRLLLRVEHPSLIDGSMSPAQWFVTPGDDQSGTPRDAPARLAKVDYDERAFCNRDLYCYDPAYDVAAAAAHFEAQFGDASVFSRRVRDHYASLTEEVIDEERWMLYQLIALQSDQSYVSWALAGDARDAWAKWRPVPEASWVDTQFPEPALIQAMESADNTLARILMRYIGRAYFADVEMPTSGPLCAIDIDGVLEMRWLGFSGTTPSGALAVRALARHGYRPVLATGRSILDVQARCEAYKIPAAVSEYGAMLYVASTKTVVCLLTEEESTHLDELRRVLLTFDGVYLDRTFQSAVRAFQVDEGGRPHGLASDLIEQALRLTSDQCPIQAIIGNRQTDFMVARINKQVGLTALASLLDGEARVAERPRVLAFAVGDAVSDLPMFAIAQHAFAPANADGAVRAVIQSREARVHLMKGPFQRGLLQAVTQFVGHDPRTCRTCRPRISYDAELLLSTLEAQHLNRWGKIAHSLRFSLRVMCANIAHHSTARGHRGSRDIETNEAQVAKRHSSADRT